MNFEVAQDRKFPMDWRVEAIDDQSGDCYLTIFSGPFAEDRAREYAEFKQRQDGRLPAHTCVDQPNLPCPACTKAAQESLTSC